MTLRASKLGVQSILIHRSLQHECYRYTLAAVNYLCMSRQRTAEAIEKGGAGYRQCQTNFNLVAFAAMQVESERRSKQ